MKWVVLGLLWVAYFLLQAMRQVYNASLPQIRADFAAAGATAVSLGLVGTVFYFVYGLCAPCASVVADVFRRKAVIVAGCLLFSVGVFASGCAGALAMIVLSYGVVNALGQSMVPASSSAVISEWHEKTRATALSIYQVANYAGIILAALLAGGVGARGAGAWRWAFWILGGFGLVWAGVLAACLRTQPAAEAGRREAPRPAAARAEKPSVRAALASVLGSPVALLLTLAFGFTMYGDNGYKVWMTTYLKDAFAATTPASAAFHAVFWFYLGAVAGIAAAGRLSDRLAPRRPAARFEVALAGLVLSAPCVALAVRARTLAGGLGLRARHLRLELLRLALRRRRAALPCRRDGALLLRRVRPRLVRAHRPRLDRGARLDGRRDALARRVLPRRRTDDPRRPPPVHAPPDAR